MEEETAFALRDAKLQKLRMEEVSIYTEWSLPKRHFQF
jgi:hypothetical protein